MYRQSRMIDASPARVWAVLADGWLHPLWMVGATAIRSVDDGWPAPGSALEHATGFWPLTLDERTEVVDSREPALLALRIVGRVLGEVHITVRLERRGAQTEVALERELVSGPRRLIPTPLRMRLLRPWGMESLTRLAFLAENRAREAPGAERPAER